MFKFIRSKNLRNAFFVFLIAFSAFFAFEPLFLYLGQKAAQEFATAIFGTIFAAVITMVLLSKQTETEEEKSRSEKVFEQKLSLYNQVMDTLQEIFEKSEGSRKPISHSDLVRLEFLLAKMIMVSGEKTIIEFRSFYLRLLRGYSSDSSSITLEPSDKQAVYRLADYYREELGLSAKNLEKEFLEDIVLESELSKNAPYGKRISSNAAATIKDLYGFLVFELNHPVSNIMFIDSGFEAYTSNQLANGICFFRCRLVEDSIVQVSLQYNQPLNGFKTEHEGELQHIFITPDNRDYFVKHIAVIQHAIKESRKHT